MDSVAGKLLTLCRQSSMLLIIRENDAIYMQQRIAVATTTIQRNLFQIITSS